MGFRRGTTFSMAGPLEYRENGVRIVDLTGYTGTSTLLDAKSLDEIATLTFAWSDATTSTCLITATATETAEWPLGRALVDIKLTTPTSVVVGPKLAPLVIEP